MAGSDHLALWTGPRIVAECREAYNAYRAAKTESYRAYFTANPGLRAADHGYQAADLASALPAEWLALADQLPESERHRHHLSGNSSQVLALGLLGVSATRDPFLTWLWEGLRPLPPASGQCPSAGFEHKLRPDVLDEHPRQTSIDFYVNDPSALLCIEAKWTEAGMGSCGCGDRAAVIGDCTERVRDRKAYWDTARDIFGLPDRQGGRPCPVSFTYQAVRNVAAALALAAPGQESVFGLIYDADNPYFAGCGRWPGWPAALQATLDGVHPTLRFAATAWQELVPLLPLDPITRAWASEKHGLH